MPGVKEKKRLEINIKYNRKITVNMYRMDCLWFLCICMRICWLCEWHDGIWMDLVACSGGYSTLVVVVFVLASEFCLDRSGADGGMRLRFLISISWRGRWHNCGWSVGITNMLPGLGYEVIGVCRNVSEAPVIVGVCAGKPWYWGMGGEGNWFRK